MQQVTTMTQTQIIAVTPCGRRWSLSSPPVESGLSPVGDLRLCGALRVLLTAAHGQPALLGRLPEHFRWVRRVLRCPSDATGTNAVALCRWP